uniref:Tubulin--tyrosine ligase-like protein 9 n=1 Tax=Nothobranchius furzeri TaxID=105023 RepID=A0A8C6Q5I6_NOTFU
LTLPKLQASAFKDNGKGEEREGRHCVHFKCGAVSTIKDVLHQRPNWMEVKDNEEWDFNWCDVGWLRENFDHIYMGEHVRINHFPNHYEVSFTLDCIRKTLKRILAAQRRLNVIFSPAPLHCPVSTIYLPKNLHTVVKLKDVTDWKKVSGFHTEEQKDAAHVESYVAQRYIENPYLLNGRKFDLRVYVLVTSYIPLKAWLYRDGFARFSNTRFFLGTINDKHMHLTNVSVQKTAPDYNPEKDCKWQLQQLRRYLTAKHGREVVETLFKEIDNIFVRSLQSVHKVIINDKHCFELYGYDILLDQNLKPWLIEVNASPSLAPSSKEDYEMKYRLLEDTLNVVDMEGRLTGKEKRVGGFDLMWNNGPVYREDANLQTFSSSCFTANTHLGCVNDREKQLSMLLKPFPFQKKM